MEEDIEIGIRLPSGKLYDANRGIFGLDEDLTLTDGYDGDVGYSDLMEFTQQDREFIADLMIDRWVRWKKAKNA